MLNVFEIVDRMWLAYVKCVLKVLWHAVSWKWLKVLHGFIRAWMIIIIFLWVTGNYFLLTLIIVLTLEHHADITVVSHFNWGRTLGCLTKDCEIVGLNTGTRRC